MMSPAKRSQQHFDLVQHRKQQIQHQTWHTSHAPTASEINY